ncbi:MAG: hypothetical protein Q9227_004331 [Pyrenula ochraceoflavens]
MTTSPTIIAQGQSSITRGKCVWTRLTGDAEADDSQKESQDGKKTKYTKVRTGCTTCKVRRVKCGEEKPACDRCTSTGRRCGGYPAPPPPKRRIRRSKYDCEDVITFVQKRPDVNSISSVWMPNPTRDPAVLARTPIVSIDPCSDDGERHSFYYFRTRVSDHVAGYFDRDFWDHLVLRTSHSDATIRHAVLALSAIYESLEACRVQPASIDRANFLKRFALHQYNRATTSLSARLAVSAASVQVVLTSCLLFIWLEFLQNNLILAYNHLRGGLRILTERQSFLDPDDPANAHLSRAFHRLHTQASIHGGPDMQIPYDALAGAPHPPIPTSFPSTIAARESLDTEMNLIFPLRVLVSSQSPGKSLSRLEPTRLLHLHRFQAWYSAYQPLLSSDEAMIGTTSRSALLQMEIQALIAIITLSTLFAPTPMAYDSQNSSFARIVQLSRELLSDETQRSHLMGLPFTTGLLRPLCCVVMRCRMRSVRREAMELLEQCEEGGIMWGKDEVLRLCTWKVGMEEGGLPGEVEEDGDGEGMVPESKRIYGERVYNERVWERIKGEEKRAVVEFKRWAGKGQVVMDEVVMEGLSMRLEGVLDATLNG